MFEEREAAAESFVAGLAAAQDRAWAAEPPPAEAPAADRDLSLPMQVLLGAAVAVVDQAPAELPGAQALADTAALLQVIEQLHAAALGRVADVDARKLHTIDGAASTSSWVAQQQTSIDRGEVALAKRLAGMPLLQQAVRSGQLSVAVAEQVAKRLAKLRRHVDRPDGLINGQPGEDVLLGVIGHGVRDLLCEALGAVADDDPRVVSMLDEVLSIVERPTSEIARLEAAFVLLAEHLEPPAVPDALGRLVDACLPNELEKRAQDGHDNRGVGLVRKSDGSGWYVTDGDLDLETGELLHTVLTAEMAVDGDNPADTQAYDQLRADGWQSGDELPTCGGPRSKRQRRHDALTTALRRLLDSGSLGARDKVAPHIAVTVGLDTLHQAPGSLPALAASGTRLPLRLVRSWWCDSAATRFVLSLGRKVIEASHTERTLKPHERRARRIETGGRCQIAGCRCGPGQKLIPHHPDPWWRCGTTSKDETVLVCEANHHDLHSGGQTLRLKDGRWLNEHGWTDRPAA